MLANSLFLSINLYSSIHLFFFYLSIATPFISPALCSIVLHVFSFFFNFYFRRICFTVLSSNSFRNMSHQSIWLSFIFCFIFNHFLEYPPSLLVVFHIRQSPREADSVEHLTGAGVTDIYWKSLYFLSSRDARWPSSDSGHVFLTLFFSTFPSKSSSRAS